MADEIYVARTGFSSYYKGQRVSVHAGDTVRAGHWLLQLAANVFEPQKVTYEYVAPAEPKRGPGRPPKSESKDSE